MSMKITRLMSDKSLDLETSNILEAWDTKNPKQSIRDQLNRIVIKAEARGRDFQRQLTGTVDTKLLEGAGTIQTFYAIKRDEEPAYWSAGAESWLYSPYLYSDRAFTESCIQPTARIVKVRVEEVDG